MRVGKTMTRRSRNEILFDGCFAHILSRSFEKRWLYEETEDFDAFKRLLLTAKKKHGFLIHHYCLMHTHFHLAVSIPGLKRFSQGFQWLKREYTVWFNKKYKRDGPLWRERFKSLAIEDESYLHACGLYIEENPVKAGLVMQSQDWPHSSARHYLLGEKDPLVDEYQIGGTLTNLPNLDESLFEKGNGIGSELFQIHLKEKTFNEISVP
jgi:putative transposase